jgi:hypothetical protein
MFIDHKQFDTYRVGLCTSDQFVAEAAAYTTHKKHKRRTSIPSARFEPAIATLKRLQAYALDRTATRTGTRPYIFEIYEENA